MGDNENRERENLLIRSFLYPRRNHAEPCSAEAAATEAATPAGCVVKNGSFLISAPVTPSASFLVAGLSAGNCNEGPCYTFLRASKIWTRLVMK